MNTVEEYKLYKTFKIDQHLLLKDQLNFFFKYTFRYTQNIQDNDYLNELPLTFMRYQKHGYHKAVKFVCSLSVLSYLRPLKNEERITEEKSDDAVYALKRAIDKT